jgi:Phage phiEco32-like COOH.NH2 ligase-type 2
MPKILVGADPELFMRNTNSGEFVSAHDRIPGTKWEPHKVPFGAIQVDGTALEFNIDPAGTVDEFVHNIKSVRSTLEGYVPGYNVVAEPVANYDPSYWKWEVPSSAQELGCNPDFNGWTENQNPQPHSGNRSFRTASGHVHIGWGNDFDVFDKKHFEYCCRVARQMDYYLGIHSLLWDPDSTRRLLYGKAGAFRAKPYGMEYRVLSNRWLDNDDLIKWVFNTVQIGMADAMADRWAEESFADIAKFIINDNMVEWQTTHSYIDLNLEPIPNVAVR